jgi:TonB family protein
VNARPTKTFYWLAAASFAVHVGVLAGLSTGAAQRPPSEVRRVQARMVSRPKPPPPKVETPAPTPPKVETPKVPKEIPKKIAQKKPKKRQGRKKRRPPRTLTAKSTTGARVAAVVAAAPDKKVGSVLDLGDLDPDATDEEVERTFDPEAEAAKVFEEAVPAAERPKDRKATCRRCVKPIFPPAATAVLPARVVLSVSVKANGKVDNVIVVRGIEPLLDGAAKRALLASTFKPAIKNGRPSADRIPFTVEFK